MTNSINFRGEVNEMSAAYFCRELEMLPSRSAANIYLHTPGGDIYAGGEMVNALRGALKRGCKISLELGALCASMGAALLAAAKSAGCRVTAHTNSEVMFHGCWSVVLGGADELTDQAKAMRDFNECVKRDLAKCGVVDTDDWFAADRQHWLNAEELKALNLVDVIAESDADDTDQKADAVRIAAKLNKEIPMTEEPKNEAAEEVAPVEAAPAAEPVAEPAAPVGEPKPEEVAPAKTAAPEACVAIVTDEAFEARVAEAANKRFAGLQAKHDKMISDLTKERDAALADLATAKATATSLQADIEKLEHDLADTRDQLAKSERQREDVVVSALAPAAELPTMADGLAACKTLAERVEFMKSGNYKS